MKLADWMEWRGISDEELAARVGVSRPTISRLRRDKLLPSFGVAKRIYVATQGEVGPSDLIELPELKRRA